MEWTPGDISKDIEDRRDEGGSGGGGNFGGFGLPHLGIGGLIIVGILSLIFHQNFFAFLGGGLSNVAQQQVNPQVNQQLDLSRSVKCNSCLLCWMTSKTPGPNCFPNRRISLTGTPN